MFDFDHSGIINVNAFIRYKRIERSQFYNQKKNLQKIENERNHNHCNNYHDQIK